MGSREFRYIGEASPEYEAEFEKRVQGTEKSGEVFGEGALEMRSWRQGLLDQIDRGKRAPDKKEQLEKEHAEALQSVRRRLQASLQGKNFERGMAAAHLVWDVWDDPEIGAQLKELHPDKGGLNMIKTAELLAPDKIDDELLTKILTKRIERFRAEEEGFKTNVALWKREFSDKVREGILGGTLPVKGSVLEQRIQETSVRLVDPLETGSAADYQNGVARVSVGLGQEKRRHATFHELTHAINGRAMGLRNHEGWERFEERKAGLMIHSRRPGMFPTGKHRWLEEAVTEDIAMELSGSTLNGYAGECAVLEELVKSGVPKELFRAAYFENYDPSDTGQDALPAWKNLVRKIREVKGEGWLTKESRLRDPHV